MFLLLHHPLHLHRYKDEVTAATAFDNVLLHISGDAAHFNFGKEAAISNRTPLDPRILKALEEYSALGPKQSLTAANTCASSPYEETAPALSYPLPEPLCPEPHLLPQPLPDSMPRAFSSQALAAEELATSRSMPLPEPIPAAAVGVGFYQQQQQQGGNVDANKVGVPEPERSARKRARVGLGEGEQQPQRVVRRTNSAPALHIANNTSGPLAAAAAATAAATSGFGGDCSSMAYEGVDDMATTAIINSSSDGCLGKLSLVVEAGAPAPVAQSLSAATSMALEGPVTPDAGFNPLACKRDQQSFSQELACQHSNKQQAAQPMQQQQQHSEMAPSAQAPAAAVAASADLLSDSVMGFGAVPELQGDLEQLMELIKHLAVHEALGGSHTATGGGAEPPMLLGAAMQLIMAKIASIKAMRQVNECLAQARLAHDKVVAAEVDLILKLQQQDPVQQQDITAAAAASGAAPAAAAAAGSLMVGHQYLAGPVTSAGEVLGLGCVQHLAACDTGNVQQQQHHMEVDVVTQPAGGIVSCSMEQQEQHGFVSMLLQPYDCALPEMEPGYIAAAPPPGAPSPVEAGASGAVPPSAAAAAAASDDHSGSPVPATAAAAAAALIETALHIPSVEVLTSSAPCAHEGKLLDAELDVPGSAGEEWWLEQLQHLPNFNHHDQQLLPGMQGHCSEPLMGGPLEDVSMLSLPCGTFH